MAETRDVLQGLEPWMRARMRDLTRDCLRSRKATVVTPAHKNAQGKDVMTVQEPFGDPFDVPFIDPLSGVKAGESVWLLAPYSDASSYVAVYRGDIAGTFQAQDSELEDHIADKNNPHQVTAQQVGAATPADVLSAMQASRAYNLLDNSDFRNPANQRGQSSYTALGYTIDRWGLWYDGATASLNVASGGLSVSMGASAVALIYQRIEKGRLTGTYTLAWADSVGTVHINNAPVIDQGEFDVVEIPFTQNATIVWAALYEGTYTVDTLPAYVPKGYAEEMAECQRYLTTRTAVAGAGASMAQRVMIYIPPMRVATPTVTYTLAGGSAPISVWMLDSTTLDVTGPAGNAFSHLYVTLNAEL